MTNHDLIYSPRSPRNGWANGYAMAIIHNEEMIRRGVLPAELDDMPEYRAAADSAQVAVGMESTA